jgi:hypothetical protein
MTEEEQDKIITNLYRWALGTDAAIKGIKASVENMIKLTEESNATIKSMVEDIEKVVKSLNEDNT